MLKYFKQAWDSVPFVVIDVETTGKRPGHDRACQVGIVRFESGTEVGFACEVVNPGISIPAEVTAIHGVTDEMAATAPTIAGVFARPDVKALLSDAQPCGFNSPFDRQFVPPWLDEWSWPWFDCLSAIRVLDRYVKGSHRHRLEACCQRHGVELAQAHNAGADARATGQLWVKVAPQVYPDVPLGEMLRRQSLFEIEDRHRFFEWLIKQPPREAVSA